MLTLQPITRRTYAAAPQKGAKPPIAIHTLEGTYASALFSASASNNNTLNDIEKSLSTIRTAIDSDAKLQSRVVNPTLSHTEKLEIVDILAKTGGGSADASKAVKNLLGVMSENGRLGHLDAVVDAFDKIMRAHKGEVEVVVTSAQPLEPRVLSRLEQAISKSPLISRGQKVRMENKVFCFRNLLWTCTDEFVGQ